MEPVEELYFNWLCAKVLELGNQNYYTLLELLHRTEFAWIVSGDRHRAEEGMELRLDFLRETNIDRDREWESQPCSVLELFVSFSKRAAFQTDIPLKVWFWEIMGNLKLDEFRRMTGQDEYEVQDILYTFIWRQYEPNGLGGMFPISRTKNDQRKVEIWYQFNEYVEDRGIL